MKVLVETTGDFMLSLIDGSEIRHEGYSLVEKSAFVQSRTIAGEIRTVAEVNDEATDDEWQKYVKESDGDLELAVASFQSAFPVDGKAEKARTEPVPSQAPVDVDIKADVRNESKKPRTRQE